jgi:hypothetical protein
MSLTTESAFMLYATFKSALFASAVELQVFAVVNNVDHQGRHHFSLICKKTGTM